MKCLLLLLSLDREKGGRKRRRCLAILMLLYIQKKNNDGCRSLIVLFLASTEKNYYLISHGNGREKNFRIELCKGRFPFLSCIHILDRMTYTIRCTGDAACIIISALKCFFCTQMISQLVSTENITNQM